MTSVTEDEALAEYIAGLHLLADLLEQHEEIPLPWQGTGTEITMHFLYGGSEKDRLTAALRAIGGTWAKDVRDNYFDATRSLRGVRIKLTAYRDAVCQRVVTGTREVTKMVPAPDAPMVERTETVEDVEWICEPLLAEAVSS